MTRSEIVRKAREYLGTPFHHQGRTKGRGVDCVGLVVCVLRELGPEIDDCRTYPQTPDSGLLLNKLRQHLEEIPIDRAVSGDVYLMTIMGYPQHVAFLTDIGIIHTHQQVGRVVETGLDHAWRRRIVKAFTIAGISDE
ncbi:MAG: C40 family peptidase [Nitrospinae bacterium]|nr:C40 family peptidase [Nitrospinota bacterium]